MKSKLFLILNSFAKRLFLVCMCFTMLFSINASKARTRFKNKLTDDKPVITIGDKLTDFVIKPLTNSTLTFKINSAGLSNVGYTISDYLDKAVSTGTFRFENGVAKIQLNLPPGYYQINIPSLNQSFGVLSILPFTGTRDPFFGIDAGLSEIETSAAARTQLIGIISRAGIAEVRERFSANSQSDLNTRQVYAQSNTPLLEVLSTGSSQNLINLYSTWSGLYNRFSSTWGAAEIGNEPELKSLPADQFMPAVKAASFKLNGSGIRAPLVGGVFALSPGRFHDVYALNGLLNNVDCVSFHNYEDAGSLEATVSKFRNWLRKSGKLSMPLWITECGMPWSSGKDRPGLKEDAESANEITMKAIEAKACGINKYMPFVLDYYNEGPKSFGMVGKERTPLRSLSAYVNCINLLSGYKYAGDLANKDPQLKLARIFKSNNPGSPLIAVLYTGVLNPGGSVQINSAAIKNLGIDGRDLGTVKNGRVPIPDGLTYVYLNQSVATSLINKNTTANKLLSISDSSVDNVKEASPIILQYIYQKSNVNPTPNNYFINEVNAKSFSLTVRLHNLSANAIDEKVSLKIPGNTTEKLIGNEVKSVTVAGKQSIDITWVVDMSKIGVGNDQLIEVDALSTANKQSLYLPFLVEGNLVQNLASKREVVQLPLADLTKWHKNNNQTGTTDFKSSNGGFLMSATFSGTSANWAYPKFDFPQTTDTSSTGLLIRARISDKSRNVALFVYTKDNKTYWVNNIFPADGAWHVVYIDFSTFQPYNTNGSNYSIKANVIKQLLLGMASNGTTNTFELSKLSLVTRK